MVGHSLTDALIAWLPNQRWFAGRAPITRVEVISDIQLAPGDPELRHLMLRVWLGEAASTYQVPVGLRVGLPPALSSVLIGRAEDGRFAYDALRDPELTALLLLGIASGKRSGPLRFMAEPGVVISDCLPGWPLSADQSNTSVVYGDQAILKLLRRPLAGQHPDLEIPSALAKLDSPIVSAPLGRIEYANDSELSVLAILSRYFPDASTAWDLAIANVSARLSDFTGQAGTLGEITALMHAELAQAFGTEALSREALARLSAVMHADLDAAMAEVPLLRMHEADIRSCYSNLERLDGMRMQRIHGDYHLGQVLEANGGWVVIDFEGEPSVPLARRRALAPATRDVACMLRSFDYASRQPFMDAPIRSSHEEVARKRALSWASDCHESFCTGYARVLGTDPREHSHTLKAFLMQKAVYEAVYEAKHRPGWLPIPMSAIAEACR